MLSPGNNIRPTSILTCHFGVRVWKGSCIMYVPLMPPILSSRHVLTFACHVYNHQNIAPISSIVCTGSIFTGCDGGNACVRWLILCSVAYFPLLAEYLRHVLLYRIAPQAEPTTIYGLDVIRSHSFQKPAPLFNLLAPHRLTLSLSGSALQLSNTVGSSALLPLRPLTKLTPGERTELTVHPVSSSLILPASLSLMSRSRAVVARRSTRHRSWLHHSLAHSVTARLAGSSSALLSSPSSPSRFACTVMLRICSCTSVLCGANVSPLWPNASFRVVTMSAEARRKVTRGLARSL